MPDTLARRFARFAANLRYDDLPPQVVDKAKACILHCIGVGLAGHGSAAVQAARAALVPQEQGGASIITDGTKTSPFAAAFINSALMHAKLQEDAYHTGSHPGVMIIPAALAVAETRGLSGRDLITAVVAGYEIEAAITADFIPSSNDQGFRSSPIYGTFGSAIAAGRLMDLDEDQLTDAIGYAATFSGGTFEGGDGTHIMVLQVAQAPRSGLLAAYLAEQNAHASETSLEGPIGFYYSFTGSRDGLDVLADHLGKRWEIMNVTLKRYPTSMFNQPPIHCMLELTRKLDLKPGDIEAIEVEMNDFETTYPGAKYRFPGSDFVRGTGSGSTAFVVAAACVNRGLSVPADRPAGWASPVQGIDRLPTHALSQELAQRVTIKGSPDINPLAPRVTVRLRSGAVESFQATGEEFKLDLAQDEEVITALAPELPGGAEQAEGLKAKVRDLDKLSNVTDLLTAAIRRRNPS